MAKTLSHCSADNGNTMTESHHWSHQQTRIMNMRKFSFDSDQGTPNDVRLFPPTGSSLTSSQRIPIVQTERSVNELMQDHNEAVAEYKEAVMFQRVAAAFKEGRRRASTSSSPIIKPAASRGGGAYGYHPDRGELTISTQPLTTLLAGHISRQLVEVHGVPYIPSSQVPMANNAWMYYSAPNIELTDHGGADQATPEEEGIFELDL